MKLTLYRKNIKDFSSFQELRELSELFSRYVDGYTSKFFVKEIAFNDTIPAVFLIDDNNNFWESDHKTDGLTMMDKERKAQVSWRG